jgi:hypothetical protein
MSGRRNYGATKTTSSNVSFGTLRNTSVLVELLTLVKISDTKGLSGD